MLALRFPVELNNTHGYSMNLHIHNTCHNTELKVFLIKAKGKFLFLDLFCLFALSQRFPGRDVSCNTDLLHLT